MSQTAPLDYAEIGTPAKRAEKGAAWLDTVDPAWHKRIRVNILDIGSHINCILAQLTKKPFDLGWITEQGGPADEEELLEFGLLHGFRLNYSMDGDELSAAWATEIAARKERDKAQKKQAAVEAAEDEAVAASVWSAKE